MDDSGIEYNELKEHKMLSGALVSVIIPCFNPKKNQLRNALNSVVSQTCCDLEIIIIDDGSTVPFDGLESEFIFPDYAIRWCRLDKNKGVAFARNFGAKLSNGKYIAFLDSDDWWDQNKLTRQVEEAKKGYDFVYTSSMFIYPEFNRLSVATIDNAEKRIYIENLLSLSTVLISKQVFLNEGGFIENEDIPEDYELWMRFLTTYKCSCVPDVYAYIDRRYESRSTNWHVKKLTYKRVRKLHENSIRKAGLWRISMASYHMAIATLQYRNRDYVQMAVSIFKAFMWNPKYVICKFVKQGELYSEERLFKREVV